MHGELIGECKEGIDKEIFANLDMICLEISTIALADTHISRDQLVAEFEKRGIDLVNILRVCTRKYEGD